MGKIDKYLQIHNLIIDEDGYRPWLSKPFNAFDKTMSSNGVMLVTTPKLGDYNNETNRVQKAYIRTHNISKLITIKELDSVINEVPLIDCYDDIESECDACNGNGYVDYVFEYKFKEYEEEHDCPICEGTGNIESKSDKPNGEKEFADGLIKIMDSYVRPWVIANVIKISEIIKSDKIEIVNVGPTLLKLIINDIEVIIAACVGVDDDEVFAIIS